MAMHSRRFDGILAAVLDIKNSLEPKIDALQIDVGLMRGDHKKIKERVEIIKSTVASNRPTVKDTEPQIQTLEPEVEELRKRIEDLEGRCRRNNVWLAELPEYVEDPSMELYLDEWFTTFLSYFLSYH
ncbi:hypothetical protein NDU88_001912 [Pleurodeles waltl]|uniref:Uncharacterized protein n=1 Tax=Pleurodeles waltl TaxID=8319 RepID=A0AAV7LZ17_PLEWA|nr:hypothetical protein NDU88_001912 [Pleurodeles waltl]